MKTFVRFGGAAALALLSYSVADAGDREGTWATLEEVQEAPEAWLNTPFTFEGRYHRLSEIYQPFFTVFDTFRYINFSAWDANRDLSQRADFMSSFSLLYIDRTKTNSVENMLALHPYQRFEATAVVKSVFDRKPFIQVIDVVALDKQLSADEIRRRAFEGADLAAGSCNCGTTHVADHVAHLAAHTAIKQPGIEIEIDAPQTIANAEVANSEIANSEIVNAEVANTEIANTEITNTEIANSEIANSEIANTEITNTEITNTEITNTETTGGNSLPIPAPAIPVPTVNPVQKAVPVTASNRSSKQ